MMLRTKIILSMLVAALIVSLIPFESLVVREWTIQFVDQHHRPVTGVKVEQVCQHYTYSESNLCAEYPDARQVTKEDGVVTFSTKSIRYSAAARAIRGIFHHLTLVAHGSVGVEAYIISSVPKGYKSLSIVNYDLGQSETTIVLEPRPE